MYSLSANGMLTVWDVNERRIVANTPITVEKSAIHPTNSVFSEDDNSIDWLCESIYLVLFNGVLYYWDILSLSVSFCNSISNYSTHSDLLSVRHFYKDQSLCFVVYQYPFLSFSYI